MAEAFSRHFCVLTDGESATNRNNQISPREKRENSWFTCKSYWIAGRDQKRSQDGHNDHRKNLINGGNEPRS